MASALLAIAILFVLTYSVGLGNFYRIIISASPAGLISAVIIYSVSWILRTVRLDSLVKNVGANVGTWELFKLYISGNALNVVLPAKLGDAAVICYLRMQGIGIGMSAAIAVQCRILDVLALLILSLPSAFLVFREKMPEWISLMLVGSLIIAALPLGVVLLSTTGKLPHLTKRNFEFLNMFIKTLQIKNFKCFGDKTFEDLAIPNGEKGSGLNILIGENGNGKTTLLEVINYLILNSYSVQNKLDISDFQDFQNPIARYPKCKTNILCQLS